MKSKPVKREVDNVVRDLFAPFLKAPRPGSGWKLLSWDAEQGLCLTFEVGGRPLLVELEECDDGRDCYARTELFNVCARAPFDPANALSDQERRFIDSVVALVRRREKRLPVFDRPATSRKMAVREILVDQILIPEGRNHYYINPYVGCVIGCPYCYVAERADLSRRLEGLPRLPWGRYADVKLNATEVLGREVRAHPPGIVRLSPILTDPYQPIERKYRITRQCLEVLLEAGFTAAVLTRAARVLEDLDLIARFDKALVGFSIPTDNDQYRAIFEPGADPVEERIEALAAFHSAGIPTIALIQPVLPMDVQNLVDQVAPHVRAVRIDRMYSLQLTLDLYRDHGLEQYATDAFFTETVGQLTEAFKSRGVLIHAMDNLESLVRP